MEKSLIDQILEVIEKRSSFTSLKATSTTIYRNKKNQTEILTEADIVEAWKKGINPSEYEVVTETVNPKEELKQMIFGNSKSPSFLAIQKFAHICSEVTGAKAILESSDDSDTSDELFKKKLAAKNQAINKAAKEGNTAKVDKLKKERVKLYIDSNVTPRATFRDLELYNKMKGNKEPINSITFIQETLPEEIKDKLENM